MATQFNKGSIVLFASKLCQISDMVMTPFGWRRFDICDMTTGEEFSVPKHCLESVQLEELPSMVLDVDWDTEILLPEENVLNAPLPVPEVAADGHLMEASIPDPVSAIQLDLSVKELQNEQLLPTKSLERHVHLDEKEIDAVANERLSRNTEHQTRWAVSLFKDFLDSRKLPQQFELFSNEELAEHLRIFNACVRQKPTKGETTGKQYSRSAYRNMRAGIQRYLVSPPNNRQVNIMLDSTFQGANQVYNGQIKKMKRNGFDVTTHKPPIDPVDMNRLYDSGTLSTDNPVSLQRKVFMEVSLHFGRRGREGWRELNQDSFGVKTDSNGKRYVTINYNKLDKNHQGCEIKDQRMYEMPGSSKCPVTSFVKYQSKLNPKCRAFLQRPDPKYQDKETWYVNSPLGVNTIGAIMKLVSQDAGCSRIYTNHSIKASTATILKQAGFAAQDIMTVTGHQNVASLNSYAQGPSELDRAKMSNTLADYGNSSQLQDSRSTLPNRMVPVNVRTPTYPAETSTVPKVLNETSVPTILPNGIDGTVAVNESPVGTVDIVSETTNRQTVTYDNMMSSIFAGATFSGNVTFNLQINNKK